jgi:hypothetical protein
MDVKSKRMLLQFNVPFYVWIMEIVEEGYLFGDSVATMGK